MGRNEVELTPEEIVYMGRNKVELTPEEIVYMGRNKVELTPEEREVWIEAFNEMSASLRERLWMKEAVDKAGLRFEPNMDSKGKQTGLRLVPKSLPTPQDANLEILR